MKKNIIFMFLLISAVVFGQVNYDLSTLRIGAFHLKMDVNEADKIAGKKLKSTSQNFDVNHVNYNDDIISIVVYGYSDSSSEAEERRIASISTTSKKFKTKSGLGVGSTKDQLIEAYKNFSNFSLSQSWDENGKPSKTESYFILKDLDAYTELSFKLINNVVVEVNVYITEDGC